MLGTAGPFILPPMKNILRRARIAPAVLVAALVSVVSPTAQSQRPMTFLDVQQLRTLGGAVVSPDRTRLAYTVSVPDWK